MLGWDGRRDMTLEWIKGHKVDGDPNNHGLTGWVQVCAAATVRHVAAAQCDDAFRRGDGRRSGAERRCRGSARVRARRPTRQAGRATGA